MACAGFCVYCANCATQWPLVRHIVATGAPVKRQGENTYPSLYLHPSRRISTCYPLLKLRVAVEIPAFRSATPEEAPLAFLERLRVDSTVSCRLCPAWACLAHDDRQAGCIALKGCAVRLSDAGAACAFPAQSTHAGTVSLPSEKERRREDRRHVIRN